MITFCPFLPFRPFWPLSPGAPCRKREKGRKSFQMTHKISCNKIRLWCHDNVLDCWMVKSWPPQHVDRVDFTSSQHSAWKKMLYVKIFKREIYNRSTRFVVQDSNYTIHWRRLANIPTLWLVCWNCLKEWIPGQDHWKVIYYSRLTTTPRSPAVPCAPLSPRGPCRKKKERQKETCFQFQPNFSSEIKPGCSLDNSAPSNEIAFLSKELESSDFSARVQFHSFAAHPVLQILKGQFGHLCCLSSRQVIDLAPIAWT